MQCKAELLRKDATISGFGEITGFYSEFIYDPVKNDINGPPKGEKTICTRIVVTSATPSSKVDVLKDAVNQGSSINDIDDKGRLIANIDITELSTHEQEKFRTSTESNPVELDVFRFDYSPSDAPCCINHLKAVSFND